MQAQNPLKPLACEIASLARQEKLVLFVGAGINGDAGWMWPELLKELLTRGLQCSVEPAPSSDALAKLKESISKEHDFYAQASIASVLLGPNRFLPILRSVVYSRLQGIRDLSRLEELCRAAASSGKPVDDLGNTKQDVSAFGYLASLARLCTRREIVAVVTYNYDTLLEYAMECIVRAPKCPPSLKRTPVPIARQIERRRDHARKDRLDIYHVHGCLPPPGSLTHLADYPVVISQQDYARTIQNPYNWEDSSQLHYLRNFPCLFLGLSMSDWNMLRLLQSAQPLQRRKHERRRLYCVGASATKLQLQSALKARLLDEFGVSFHAAGHRKYAQLRRFSDELYFKLVNPP